MKITFLKKKNKYLNEATQPTVEKAETPPKIIAKGKGKHV